MNMIFYIFYILFIIQKFELKEKNRFLLFGVGDGF